MPDNETQAAKVPQVHVLSGWRSAIAWPFAKFVSLWGRTLRMRGEPETIKALSKVDEALAVVLWHNRLFMTAEIGRRFRPRRPIYALVSASKDGAWLEAFFSLVNIRCVRGSSSRLGREAATALIEVLRRGDDIGITPDGPRGPCYVLKPGGLIVTRRTHTPMLVMGFKFSSALRLKSWDRFYIPLPFSKVTMYARIVRHEELPEDRDEAVKMLQALLMELNPD